MKDDQEEMAAYLLKTSEYMQKEIAVMVGLTTRQITQINIEQKIRPFKRTAITEEIKDTIHRMLEDNVKMTDISRWTGVSGGAISLYDTQYMVRYVNYHTKRTPKPKG